MNAKKMLIAVGAVLVVIVLLQNTQVVSVRFLLWQMSMSQIIFMPLVMAVGFGVGYWAGKKS